MLKVEHSTDYESFQLIHSNRKISPTFVQTLVNDPTFPEGYKYCPTIVNDRLEIIDGQHRFMAAKTLGIPVYYLKKSGATTQDIKTLNSQQHKWEGVDYLNFYCLQGNENYIVLKTLRDKFSVPIYLINTMFQMMEEIEPHQYRYLFKRGELKLKKKKQVEDCLTMILNTVNTIRVAAIKRSINIILSESYFYAFAKIYTESIPLFKTVLERLKTYYTYLPMTRSNNDAIECLKSITKTKVRTRKSL